MKIWQWNGPEIKTGEWIKYVIVMPGIQVVVFNNGAFSADAVERMWEPGMDSLWKLLE